MDNEDLAYANSHADTTLSRIGSAELELYEAGAIQEVLTAPGLRYAAITPDHGRYVVASDATAN